MVTLNLTVNQPTTSSLSATICAPATYDFNGQILGSTGNYTSTLINAVGCDTVITLLLTVNEPSSSAISATICAPATYDFNGQTLGSTGTYTSTHINAVGCDSVVTLNLTVNQPTTSSFSVTICAPATYDFNGQILGSTGTYTSTLINAVGCDSVVTLNLTVNHPTASSFSATICAPVTYDFNGQILGSTGNYTSTLINAVGCDSVITLQLTVNEPSSSAISSTICAPATYDFNGQTLGSTGTYTSTLINAVGCDSVITLNLTVNQPSNIFITDTICAPLQYTVGSQTLSASGTYNITLMNQAGCDSNITLNLHIDQDLLSIIQQPQARQLLLNDTGIFAVEVSGARNYRWQHKQGNVWENLLEQHPYSGTSTPNLRFIALASLQNTEYRLKASGCQGIIYSNTVLLSVHPQVDSIRIELPIYTSCPGDTINIPIRISGSSQIGAIQVDFSYDTTAVQWLSYSANPQNGIILQQQNGLIHISRQATNLLPFYSDTLLTLRLVVMAQGNSSFHWQIPSPGSIGISTPSPEELLHRVSYRSGGINASGNRPTVQAQPLNTDVLAGQPVVLNLQAQNIQAIQWQQFTNGVWIDLFGGGLYHGVNSDSLIILNTPDSLNLTRYRAVLFGTCPSTLISNEAVLTVLSNRVPVVLQIDSLGACPGGTVQIPIRLSQAEAVDSFHLVLTYNPDSIQLQNTGPVHPSLAGRIHIQSTPGRLQLSGRNLSGYLTAATMTILSPSFMVLASSRFELDSIPHSFQWFSPYRQSLHSVFVSGGVFLNVSPNIEILPLPFLCTADAPFTLQANPAGGVFSGSGVIGNQLYPVLGAGTRLITYSVNVNGCVLTTQSFMTIYTTTQGSAGMDQQICYGSSATLTASGGSRYRWSIGDTTASIQVLPTSTSSYWVEITNSVGCSSFDTVQVVVIQPIQVSAGPDQTICPGGSAVLMASGAAQYYWTFDNGAPAIGLSSLTSPNPVASPTSSTVYVVRGFGANGCVSTDTVRVIVNSSPVISLSDTAINYCPGTPAVALQAFGASTYTWTLSNGSPSTGLSGNTGSLVFASPMQTTVYRVTGTNAQGCTSTANVTVYVERLSTGPSRIICQGSSTTLSANYSGFTTFGQQVFYQWTPTTGLNNPNVAQPVASPSSTIQYRVYAYSAGCTLTAVVSVIVNPSPTVQAGPDVSIAPGSSIRLQARISGGTSPIQFSWSPTAGLSNSTILDPIASPLVSTNYVLTVTPGNGCVRSDTIRVGVDSSITGHAVGGRVVYDNAQLTPLSQATVVLENLGSAPAPAPPPSPHSTALSQPSAGVGVQQSIDSPQSSPTTPQSSPTTPQLSQSTPQLSQATLQFSRAIPCENVTQPGRLRPRASNRRLRLISNSVNR